MRHLFIELFKYIRSDKISYYLTCVERSSSVVECRTRNRESPGSNPPLLPFRRLGIFRSLHRRPCSLSCINENLAIDSGGNVSDLVLARNCCLARMLPGEAENGVGMNRSVREGKSVNIYKKYLLKKTGSSYSNSCTVIIIKSTTFL